MRTMKERLSALEKKLGQGDQYVFEWPAVGIRWAFSSEKACCQILAKCWVEAVMEVGANGDG